MANTKADIRRQIGSRVEYLFATNTSGGSPHYIAYSVATGLAGGQTHGPQKPQHFRAFGQWDVVKLDVFPSGDVALAQWSIMFRHVAQAIHALGGQNATRHFNPNHLHVRLSLAVHTLAQTERSEYRVVPLASHEGRRFVFQPPNLFVHKRDNPVRCLGKLHAIVVDLFQGPGLSSRGLAAQSVLPNLAK